MFLVVAVLTAPAAATVVISGMFLTNVHSIKGPARVFRSCSSSSSSASLEEADTRLDIVTFELSQSIELLQRHGKHRLKLRHFQVSLQTHTHTEY